MEEGADCQSSASQTSSDPHSRNRVQWICRAGRTLAWLLYGWTRAKVKGDCDRLRIRARASPVENRSKVPARRQIDMFYRGTLRGGVDRVGGFHGKSPLNEFNLTAIDLNNGSCSRLLISKLSIGGILSARMGVYSVAELETRTVRPEW